MPVRTILHPLSVATVPRPQIRKIVGHGRRFSPSSLSLRAQPRPAVAPPAQPTPTHGRRPGADLTSGPLIFRIAETDLGAPLISNE
jgi:hypothetical protein